MTNPYQQNPNNEDPYGQQGGQNFPNPGDYNQYPNQSADYGAQQGQGDQPGMGNTPPDSWMWATILTTILCCLPVGAVGIYFSSQVQSRWFRGDYAGAQDASKKAKNFAIASAVLGVVVIVLYVVIFVAIGDDSLSESNV